MIRCVLGGQSALFLEGLRSALTRESFVEVSGVETEPEAVVRLARACDADALVLTFEPPRISVEVAEAAQVPTLLLTWSPRVQDAVAALRAGVQGFLTKDAPPRQVQAALRGVVAGCLSYPREYANLIGVLGTGGPSKPRGMTFTEREHAVVDLVAQGLTSQQIASRLGIAPQTVKNHVNSAMRKVGVNSRLQLAAWVGQRLPSDAREQGRAM